MCKIKGQFAKVSSDVGPGESYSGHQAWQQTVLDTEQMAQPNLEILISLSPLL